MSRANRNHKSYQRYDRRYVAVGFGNEVGNHEALPPPVALEAQSQLADANSNNTNADLPISGKKVRKTLFQTDPSCS